MRALRAGDAEPGRCVFDAPAYREAYGFSHVLRVDVPGSAPLLFDDRGDHAVYLARSETLDAAAIGQAGETLFTLSRIRFVVFEDIGVDGPARLRPATLRFRYHNDWVLPFGDETRGMTPSFRRKVDKKLRRLERQHGDMRLVIETSPSRAVVERVIQLARKKFEANGRTYLIDEAEKERLVPLFKAIGTAAILYHGEHVASCDLFVEHGQDAYAFLGSYDAAYAKESPGMITVRHGIEHFEARGFRSLHLLWGDGDYKASFGAVQTPLSTLIVPRNAGALLNRKLLARAARFGAQHVRERLRERPWLGEPLRWVLDRVRSLRAKLRGGG